MKTLKKTLQATLLLILTMCFACEAQTNVSGGIYTNTTWTKANSPYIVTDTIVVFPGNTLTIEPGVTVKFADKQELEIRQAELIAVGTATDSITFTSNSNSPTSGIYGGVYLNGGSMPSQIGYCNFYYAHTGADFATDSGFTIKHCKLMYNSNGIWSWGPNGLIDSCEIKYTNEIAVFRFQDVTNCTISNNNDGTYQCFNIDNCVIDSNSDAGIYQNYGPISNCFVRNNSTAIFFPGPNTIYNCIISNNQTGINMFNDYSPISYCTIDSNSCGIFDNGHGGPDSITNCLIEYNDTGFYDQGGSSYIADCRIQYNITGISDIQGANTFTKNIISDNTIGILLNGNPYPFPDSIYCNSICNNTTYNLKYELSNNSNIVSNNYWCTSDSASIASLIYDGYENVSYGLVTFTPFDTVACSGIPAGIPIYEDNPLSFSIFPNPASDVLTVDLRANSSKAEIRIFNLLGDLAYLLAQTKQETSIDISTLANGMYIIQITTGNNIARQKFIKEKNIR